MTISSAVARNVRWMIDSLGQDMSYVQRTSGGYDPTTSSVTAAGTSPETVFGALAPFETGRIDGESILAEDRQILFAAGALSVTPRVDDEVKANGETFRVVNVQNVTINGQTVALILQGRA